MSAPVCLIEPDIKIEQPDLRRLPAIPIAHDLHSAIASINAMRQLIYWLMFPPQGNNRTNNGQGTNSPRSSPLQGASRFKEIKRTVKVVRVFNPDDHAQFVDVEQIMSLTMEDTKTKETWGWSR